MCTNIVIFRCEKSGITAAEVCEKLRPHGIWALDTDRYLVRFVTHCDVGRAGVDRAVRALESVVS